MLSVLLSRARSKVARARRASLSLSCGAVGVTFFVAGCVHFQPKPLDVKESGSAFEARTLSAPELRAFIETNLGPVSVWPPVEWNFEQLTLAALFFNPSLDVARAQFSTVRAGEITAGARPNPTLGVTPEYSFNPEGAASPWVAAVQLDIPIETAGKRGHRITMAEQLSEAAKFQFASAAWKVRSDLRGAVLDFQDATERTEILTRQVEVQQKVVSDLELKLSLGAASVGEVAPARLTLASTRKDLADARVQVDEARARLATAIGVPVKSLPSIAVLEFDAKLDTALTSDEARQRALTARPDLLAALADYAAAETNLKLEIAKQYPDVHLGTGYQFDQGQNKWSLGLSAEIPVLNQNHGPIAEAEGRRAEAAARVLELQASIIGDVDRTLAVWRGAQARRSALDEMRAAQETRAKSLRAQLDAGAVEALDVQTAEAELQLNELLFWEEHIKALRALGDLEDAIQFPLPLDVSSNPRLPKL